MPTASSGLPDRSDSGRSRKARLSKDDDRLLSDGPGPAGDDEPEIDEAEDDLTSDLLGRADDDEAGDLDEDTDAEDDDAEDDERETSGTTLTKKRTTKAAASTKNKPRTSTKARRPKDQRTGNPFVALARFIREVIGEMRKVLWPTRRELVVYTIAVIIFVTVLISIVGGLDFGFARLVLLIFG